MAKKDNRIKGCPNVTCADFLSKEKYSAGDNYCRKCGTPLVFVCARCFRKIEDAEGQRLCPDCSGKKKTKVADATKKAAFVVRQKAPEALETAKVLAKNEHVRRAATIAVVMAADHVRSPKIKRIAKIVIRTVK